MSQGSSEWETSWNGQQIPQSPVEREEVGTIAEEPRQDGHEKHPVTLRELMSALAASDIVPDSDIEHHDQLLHRSLEVGLGTGGDTGEDWRSNSDSLLDTQQREEIEVRPLIAPEALESSPAERFAVSYHDPVINPSPSRSSWTHDDQSTPLRRSHDTSSLIEQPNNDTVQLGAPEEPHAPKRNPKYPPERLSMLLNMDLDADDTPSPTMPSMVEFVDDFMAQFSKFFVSNPPAGSPGRILLTDLRCPAEKGRITMQLLAALGMKLHTTSKSRAKSGLQVNLWADVFHPTNSELHTLARAFGVHALTAEDICTDYTRVKLEDYHNYLYVVLREDQVSPGSNIRELMPIHLLVFPHMGITLSIHPEPINALASVMYFVDWEDAGHIEHTGYVLYKYLDTITDQFMAIVDGMWTEVQSLDKIVIRVTSVGDRTELILRTAAAAQRIAGLRNTLLAQQEIVRTLLGTKLLLTLHPTTKIYLRDVDDHLTAMLQRLDMSTEMLNNTNATNLAMISLLMTDSANEVNEVMKRFSAVATIVLPMTLVSSLWGMNVMVPGQTWPEGPANLVWFFLICVLMGGWFVVGVIYLRMQKFM